MKVTVTKKGKQKMAFSLEGVSIPFANALRRIMISEIPVLAVDYLEMHENSSPLFDELIAQRIGIIPLDFDPSKFNFQGDCKCAGKGCPSCQVVLALEAKGPGKVYSKSLKSSNKSVKPTEPGFIIVDLLDKQSLKLEAIARLGTGKEHAKFQAANVTFQNYPEIKGDKINTEPMKFMFTVETISGLSPQYIVSKAVEILQDKAHEFKKKAAKL